MPARGHPSSATCGPASPPSADPHESTSGEVCSPDVREHVGLRGVSMVSRIFLGTVAVGVATIGYAAVLARRRWRLRQATLPVLPDDAAPLRILHISDLHMMPNQRSKQRWVAELD